MKAQHNSKTCCPPQNATSRKSYIRTMSLLSASGAAGLVGISCLGCIPIIGAALGASAAAAFLDENLLFVQLGLIALSAGLSCFYVRKNDISRFKSLLIFSAYLILAVNVIFLREKTVAFTALIALGIAHFLKSKSALRLIYFAGCPTHPRLKKELDDRGLIYREIDLDRLPGNDPQRKYSSPALLFREEVLFGTSLTSNSTSCSFASDENLLAAVERAILLSRE